MLEFILNAITTTTQMSSQLDPTLGPATQADAACMKEGAKIGGDWF